jgi:ribA/ribD-fused uncharacterized protein
MIHTFAGEYEFLCNFHPCQIWFQGIEYPSVEHAYQASKTLDIEHKLRIAKLRTAGQAKREGKRVQLRPDWKEQKIRFMTSLLHVKFSQEPFKSLLKATGDQQIEEGNYWHDNFWGICTCNRCSNIRGENHLGRLLMEIRAIL